MKMEWNENTSQLMAEKIRRIKAELGDKEVDIDSVSQVLEVLHPEVSQGTLYSSVKEMKEGIRDIYQAETEQMNKSAAQIISGQLQGMTEEQQKGYLCQLFDSIKLSDESGDSEIEKAEVQSTDLAQMALEELQELVSKQLVYSVSGFAYHTLEDNLQSIAGIDFIALKTEEDALLMAAAQYSEALDGNIAFEYSKAPRLLGQCAAAQTKMVAYCEDVMEEDIPEEMKRDKVLMFIKWLFAILICVAFTVLAAGIGGILTAAAFEMVTALLGTGIIALVVQCLLVFPIALLSFAAVLGAGAVGYAAVNGACELFKTAVPKIKEFYGKVLVWLGKENPFGEEEKEEEQKPEDMEQNDMEEEEELAYT